MIKNFIKMQGKELHVPVWGAKYQRYNIQSVHESTNHSDYWEGQLSTKKIFSPAIVPIDLDIIITKPITQMEWSIQVVYTNELGGDSDIRTVMVLPKHLKSPEAFGKLIAEIIDNPNNNYFN